MFCGPETVDVPEANPRETSTVEGPQNNTAFPSELRTKIREIFY